jgi:hypothetical protein
MTTDPTLSGTFRRSALPWTVIGLLCGTIGWPFISLAWGAGGALGLLILLLLVAPLSLLRLFGPVMTVMNLLADHPDREPVAVWTALLPGRLAALGGGLAGIALGTVLGWALLWSGWIVVRDR